MNGEVFIYWVKGENMQMALEAIKIIILMDYIESYDIHGHMKIVIGGFSTIILSNIIILFLPPNVTSVVEPLDQSIIATFKMLYKRKFVAWTLQQLNAIFYEHLGRMLRRNLGETNLFQAMLWSIAIWNELDKQAIINYWKKSSILPLDWNVDTNNLDERVKVKMEDEATKLEKFIEALKSW